MVPIVVRLWGFSKVSLAAYVCKVWRIVLDYKGVGGRVYEKEENDNISWDNVDALVNKFIKRAIFTWKVRKYSK